MGFRDDDDALRARAERLETELRERERELSQKDAELERLRDAATKPPEAPASDGGESSSTAATPDPGWWASMGWGDRFWLLVGFAGMASAVAMPILGVGSCIASQVCGGAPGELGPDPTLARHAVGHWTATIASVRGGERLRPDELSALSVGAPCAVAAELASDGASVVETSVSIVCGTRVVYPATRIGPGTVGSCEVWEGVVATGEARYEYGLVCHDPGGIGRPALSLATRSGTARVLAGDLEIDLTVSVSSAESTGEPLMLANGVAVPTDALVERTGHVSEVGGAAPHAIGAACTLRIFRASPGGPYDCRVRLACDERPLYGSDAANNGYNDCTEDAAGLPIGVSDPHTSAEDTDPAIELDVPAGTARVRDEAAGVSWTVTVTLDTAP